LPSSAPAFAPHASRRVVTLAQPAPKTAGAYKTRWNAICAANPVLGQAKIK
jgi:hypothetical protein